ncbi:MAG: hypothetical protein COB85_05655 [Bacteroidetes bacterium]|nr:MAG: hypothetical protein COB85_05655 [Bacteroidota bacterium]
MSQECGIIYVTPTGASSGTAGTKATPASLTYGLSLATSADNQIWLASGNYSISTTLFMISDVTVEGGFDQASWIKTNNVPSVINRDNSNMQTLPNRLVAVECTGITNFRLQDLTINVANGLGNGVSIYGIHLDGCTNYSVTRCIVITGNATGGLQGGPGIGGISGANGSPGQGGDGNGGCCTGGGAAGSGSYVGSNAGGVGGDGGARGGGGCPCGSSAPDGILGQNGAGTGGGTGGAGGLGYCVPLCASTGCDAGPANAGDNGIDGANGLDGAAGVTGTPTFGNYFVNGDGVPGVNGDNGAGGGGGGGGGSQGCLSTCWPLPNNNGSGAGGGGGGEGGQGGFGATGGTGGGGSFPIYIFNNLTGTEVKDCSLNSGLQGLGGLGGIPGGLGGGSGVGAISVSSDCDLGDPGDGGDGGVGGMGGNGGNGASGVSFPLFEDPFGLAVAQSDMRSQVEPQIFVKNTGCTWSDIEFYTDASGIILWYFDGGAMPLTATGDSAIIQYSSMGRHTITLVVDGVPYIFTDFVGIFSDGIIPIIISADSVTCPGTNATFTSSISNAVYYDWVVYDTPIVGFSGAGTTSINHAFADTGTYIITLQTTSICCGRSKIDTFEVIVAPVLTPLVYVSVTSAAICAGDQTTFGAVPINGGTSPIYQWLVNGSPVGSGTNTFSSSSLSDGDIITCFMISNYPCAVPIDATSIPITIEVNPLPVVACNISNVYLGAFTIFDATTSTGSAPFTYNWEFGDGGIETGATTSHYYGSTGSYYYSVTVTDSNGCVGVCSDNITIIVAPTVDASFTSNSIPACDSTTVTFTDASNGSPISWYWDFGDGVTIGPGSGPITGIPNTSGTYDNPTHVYSYVSPGVYNVTLVASNGVYADTVLYPNYVVVKLSPIAGLTSLDTSGCTSISTQFRDASPGGFWFLWDFDDATTSTRQNPSHSYTSVGTYNVSVTVWNQDSTCMDMASMSINVYETPFANFMRDTACSSVPIQFTNLSFVTGNSTITGYEWDFGDGTDSITDTDPIHTYDPGGTYYASMIATSNFGCKDTAFDTILIYTKPVAMFDAVPDSVTILSPEITFTDQTVSDSIATWNWQFGNGDSSIATDPVHEYLDTGFYMVLLTVVDTNGCFDTVSRRIDILPDYIFFLPNTFTPNQDGINELFIPLSTGLNESGYNFYIFTRWGDAIFHTTDINEGWTGLANNGTELAQTGVYVWLVLSKDLGGANHQYTGHVTLIR